MKLRLIVLLLSVILIFVGCDSKSNNRQDSKDDKDTENESSQSTEKTPDEEMDIPSLYDDSYTLPEEVFSFANLESEQVEAVAKFCYYNSFEGNGSFDYETLIYRYRNHLVCTWRSFECGDSISGSFLLTQEQGETFFDLVADHTVTEEPEEVDGAGDTYYSYVLKYGDTTSYVEALDLHKLDLDIPEEVIMDDDAIDIIDLFSFSEAVEEKLGTWDDTSILVPWQYCDSVYQQVIAYTGKAIESAAEVESNELEIKLELELENGDILHVVTTYTGQVIAYRYN